MIVLHITNNYPTSKYPIFGIFVKEQIDSLSAIGIKNKIFFINGREKGRLEYLKSMIRLRYFLKNNRFDIVHCHHAFSAICYILTGLSKKNRSVVSYQNDPSNELGSKLFRFIQKHTDATIVKNLSSSVENQSIFYQPNGVNFNFFHPIPKDICLSKLNLDPQKKYILFVSSNFIREQKRYDRFQEVLEILRTEFGLDNIEELKLINTKRDLVPYFFNAASLHLLSSDFEGSPNSVKEAMACNIPVVSTNVGNVAELLANVSGSYVSETNDPNELAKLAYNVLIRTEPFNSQEILIEKKLDIESVAENIVQLYKRIIND